MPSLALLIFTVCLKYSFLFGQGGNSVFVDASEVSFEKDTMIRNKLMGLDLKKFEGRTVGEFLKNDTVRLYKSHWFSDEPPMKLRSLNLTYARGLYLEIYFAELKYQPRFSEYKQFSFKKILKETISKVKLDSQFFDDNLVKKYDMQN